MGAHRFIGPALALCMLGMSNAAAADQDRWKSELLNARQASLRGEYMTAVPVLERLVKEAKEFGSDDLRYAVALHYLADSYKETGRFSEAERCFEDAIALFARRKNPNDAHLLRAMNNLAGVHIESGQLGKADRVLKRLGAILDTCGRDFPEELAIYRNYRACILVRREHHSEAELLLGQALADAEKQLGPFNSKVGNLLNSRGTLMCRTKRWSEAAADFERAALLVERAYGASHPLVARGLTNLAVACRQLGDTARAEGLLRRALAIFEDKLGPEHPDIAMALLVQAAVLRDSHRGKDAKALQQRARSILARRAKEHGLNDTVDISTLAMRPSK
jgi:tetratricopeptide (TPR) repeat protein